MNFFFENCTIKRYNENGKRPIQQIKYLDNFSHLKEKKIFFISVWSRRYQGKTFEILSAHRFTFAIFMVFFLLIDCF